MWRWKDSLTSGFVNASPELFHSSIFVEFVVPSSLPSCNTAAHRRSQTARFTAVASCAWNNPDEASMYCGVASTCGMHNSCSKLRFETIFEYPCARCHHLSNSRVRRSQLLPACITCNSRTTQHTNHTCDGFEVSRRSQVGVAYLMISQLFLKWRERRYRRIR